MFGMDEGIRFRKKYRLRIGVSTTFSAPWSGNGSHGPCRVGRRHRTVWAKTVSDLADSLDAFVLDYFPDVHGEFASGMTRDKRRSLLLEMHKPEVVLEKLRRSKPKQVEANESVLEWEE